MLRPALRALGAASASGAAVAAYVLDGGVRPMTEARRDAYVCAWARAMRRALAVDLVVHPPGRLPRDEPHTRPRLVVTNHRSTLDIPIMLELFGGHLLARGDMAEWPVVGAMARLAGTLFVDREDPQSGASAVLRIREKLRSGRSVTVFPEGTTFPGDDVRPFHAGAFIPIARERGEVWPAGIAYASEDAVYGDEPIGAHMKRLTQTPQIRVAVAVGTPMSAAGLGVQALCAEAHAAVTGLVVEARGLLGSHAEPLVTAVNP
jgi:lyso-ornithine lipid O-acyltransferase